MITGSRKKDAVFYSSAMPPSSPDRLSSFGQGQAVAQVTGSSYTGAVNFGAGLPGDFDFAVFSLFLQIRIFVSISNFESLKYRQ